MDSTHVGLRVSRRVECSSSLGSQDGSNQGFTVSRLVQQQLGFRVSRRLQPRLFGSQDGFSQRLMIQDRVNQVLYGIKLDLNTACKKINKGNFRDLRWVQPRVYGLKMGSA